MAAASAAESSLLSLLSRSYPQTVSSDATQLDLQHVSSKIFPAVEYTAEDEAAIEQWLDKVSQLKAALGATGEDAAAQTPQLAPQLAQLNAHLSTRATLLGAKPCVADIAVYALLAPVVEQWTPEQRTGEAGFHHIVRFVDFVQNADDESFFRLQMPRKVRIDLDDVRVVPRPKQDDKDRKKKEKAAALDPDAGAGRPVVVGSSKPAGAGGAAAGGAGAGAGGAAAGGAGAGAGGAAAGAGAAPTATATAPAAAGKKKEKEKKEKKEKQPKAAATAAPAALSPSLIDLRVGHILRAVNHPNADSLYVSTIDCGDAPGADNTSVDEATGRTVRTVCSGLNGLVPLDEMQGRKVVVVCNLKPVTMRGIKSAAMVLAASPRPAADAADAADGHGVVELVSPPADAPAGERVAFDGWSDGEPEKVLNPKKKIWETFQPGFTTTDSLEVAFDSGAVPAVQGLAPAKPRPAKLQTASGAVCTVKSLRGGTVR